MKDTQGVPKLRRVPPANAVLPDELLVYRKRGASAVAYPSGPVSWVPLGDTASMPPQRARAKATLSVN